MDRQSFESLSRRLRRKTTQLWRYWYVCVRDGSNLKVLSTDNIDVAFGIGCEMTKFGYLSVFKWQERSWYCRWWCHRPLCTHIISLNLTCFRYVTLDHNQPKKQFANVCGLTRKNNRIKNPNYDLEGSKFEQSNCCYFIWSRQLCISFWKHYFYYP